MEALLLGTAALACPVGMGAMMWFMMRGHKASSAAAPDHELTQLGPRSRASAHSATLRADGAGTGRAHRRCVDRRRVPVLRGPDATRH